MNTAPHGVTLRARRMLLALPTAVVVAALVGPPSFAATATPVTGASALPPAQPQGFIMSDGRICDPIRHIGC